MARLTNNDGQVVLIDSLRRVFVLAVDLTIQQTQNAAGNTLSLVVDGVSGAGAEDYILYFENVGSYELNITSIYSMASAATTLWIDHVSGTASYVAATDTERTDRLLGDPTNPVIDSQYDTNITGLSQQGKLFFERCAVADERYHLNGGEGFVIDPGEAFAVRSSNPAATITLEMALGISII